MASRAEPHPTDAAEPLIVITPDIRDYLRATAQRLDAAGHGQATAVARSAAEHLGWSLPTLYRQLQASVGWRSGRSTRRDKGSTSVPEAGLLTLAAAQREAVRDNGKRTLHTTTALGILQANGIDLAGVSSSHANRLMRSRRLDAAAQARGSAVTPLRALHPNHVHEVDPSLCLVYYLHGRQHLIRDREFYKNKLDAVARVQLKVWRYVLYDRASGAITPWYVEAAGESQHNLFEFLMHAWGSAPGRVQHGVPRVLLWDKGSANTSAAIANLLHHLDVQPLEHAAGQARVKGGVEGANNVVETQFESRLRFEPVGDVQALNAAASTWAAAYNANLIPGQDTRLHRPGLAVPVARTDLWLTITADQLRTLPPVEVCRALMAARPEERKVRPDVTVTYRHPQAERSALYSLRGLPGVAVGDTVTVRPLVYAGDCAIEVHVPRYDGSTLIHRVEPQRGYDHLGQLLDAPVIGQQWARSADTPAEQAAQALDATAWPGLTADEIKRARERKATPFAGELRAHSILDEVELPTYMPRRGEQIATPAHLQAEPALLDATTAMLRIVQGIGRHLSAQEHAFLSARYAEGVPEDQLAQLVAQFSGAAAPEPQRAAGGLRAV